MPLPHFYAACPPPRPQLRGAHADALSQQASEEEEVPVDLSEYQFKPLRPPSPSEAPLAMNERKRRAGAKLRDHNTAEGRGGTAGRGGGGFNAEKKKPRSEKAPPIRPRSMRTLWRTGIEVIMDTVMARLRNPSNGGRLGLARSAP